MIKIFSGNHYLSSTEEMPKVLPSQITFNSINIKIQELQACISEIFELQNNAFT